jgi:hypothetical protein
MALRPAVGDVALESAARGSGTHVSGPIGNAGQATAVLLMVHCTAASGTSPTLNVSLQDSADGVSWAAVANSGTTQLTAAGNAVAAAVAPRNFVRVTATVAGTTPSFTFSASVLAV